MNAESIMMVDGQEYRFGTYLFETAEQKDHVNERAMEIREERGVETFVRMCG